LCSSFFCLGIFHTLGLHDNHGLHGHGHLYCSLFPLFGWFSQFFSVYRVSRMINFSLFIVNVEGNGIHATQVSNQDTAVLLHYP
jgi:hypothetical protein